MLIKVAELEEAAARKFARPFRRLQTFDWVYVPVKKFWSGRPSHPPISSGYYQIGVARNGVIVLHLLAYSGYFHGREFEESYLRLWTKVVGASRAGALECGRLYGTKLRTHLDHRGRLLLKSATCPGLDGISGCGCSTILEKRMP